jgi:hypothetical protein
MLTPRRPPPLASSDPRLRSGPRKSDPPPGLGRAAQPPGNPPATDTTERGTHMTKTAAFRNGSDGRERSP